MYFVNKLSLYDFTVEHLNEPLGIDVKEPRFAWKLRSNENGIVQKNYRLRIFDGPDIAADTGVVTSEKSIEVTVPGFLPRAMTVYRVCVSVTDNFDREAELETLFETGRMDLPFFANWVEPIQEPTPSNFGRDGFEQNTDSIPRYENGERTFEEFRPAQYIRIPFVVKSGVKRARAYVTAHGLYSISVNGQKISENELAPENTAYNKLLLYQTYDVTALLREGENVFGVILADGWYIGRVGTTGDCCQYGDTLALLLQAEIEYIDNTKQTVTGEAGKSHTGPIIFSDLFVGEKYDARLELPGWDSFGFPDDDWLPVVKKIYDKGNIKGQRHVPVRVAERFHPASIFTAPNGDTIIDAGQNIAGIVEFTVTSEAGKVIRLEHFETLDKEGNYFNSILNSNKEQTVWYTTKDGAQTFRPRFTYHGFRYVRITGWPGRPTVNDFSILTFAGDMKNTGEFSCSDPRINQLQRNIRQSQTANTVSIPTDCPQREKAGWTGDIAVYSPTMCFNSDADAFLSSWMDNVRAEQLENGAIPMIVPYLKAYATFLKSNLGSDTSCGWGDAVITVPYSVYKAYGDLRILEENYAAMLKWMDYIDERAKNHHPTDYENWSEERKLRSRWLWNTDYHFGDWLIPSMVLGNPDGNAMGETAAATMGVVAPAYYAFSAKTMAEISDVLGEKDNSIRFRKLYENIRQAFIDEYVHDDGTMDADFQGIYVIALQTGLVTDDQRAKMTEHLCRMIEENRGCLDTGFLSVPFLMDVLYDNGKKDVAFKLLFQTACPSWLYEIEKGATTLWESWGAVSEDGTVSTYSYNHYAFGCVGDWIYRRIGGLTAVKPGYKEFRVEPELLCGLSRACVSEETPYGTASVKWYISESQAFISVEVPCNCKAELIMKDRPPVVVGSGSYQYIIKI